MCRLSFHVYKEHHACFHCCKMFRPAAREDLAHGSGLPSREPRRVTCPQCRGPMRDMGKNFKPPKQRDAPQWRKVQLLRANGLAWHDCGCGGYGPAVKAPNEVEPFLESRRQREEERRHLAQKQVAQDWREAKRKKHRSYRRPDRLKSRGRSASQV